MKRLLAVSVFGTAMGFLEATVVVYLRELHYPAGFAFPLKSLLSQSLLIESLREISTILMLTTLGIAAGSTFAERFSFFLFSFGTWDIFYYVWLKALLDWPSSVFTWDILFLIPVVWVGPVLAPVICSATMVVLSISILYHVRKGRQVRIKPSEWLLMGLGALLIFFTFIRDFSRIIVQGGFLPRLFTLGTDTEFQKVISGFIPASYNWYLFAAGEILIMLALLLFWARMSTLKVSWSKISWR